MAPPNVKIKHLIRSTSGNSRFPKLDECAHFHYENVELGPINVVLCDKQAESSKLPTFVSSSPNKENEVDRFCFLILVISNSRKWVVRRTYNDFVFLDTQLHRCVYDRKYSLLHELQSVTQKDLDDENAEERIRASLNEYLERFSQLAGSLITCGPVLNWLELDNRGNRLIVTDEVAINTPAVAAAYVVIRYNAQAADEISFDVGDMISVIDMPPPDESTWWRGKRGFEVGFFPSECVEVIGDKVPRGFKLSSGSSTKPVFRKHGKLIAFFRSFLLSRPSRRKLKQSGILKERVFGCDLGEHLLNTAREIPLVLKCCTEFIEEHGVVDGIYRLSGVSSNIQRLRNAFDEDCATNLGDPTIAQDIHSVASLLKMYFRELPNPLLTYQLYDKFVCAVQSNEDVRLLRIRDVVQQLPPPHFRTLQYLLSHLARVASRGEQTGMTPKNIAIVWAPNLLRSREVENGGVGALHVVGVQAVLTEYLIRYCDLIFDEKTLVYPNADHEEGMTLRARPKSLAISTPTKLLSLEEARARALSTHLPLTTQQKYIDVGGGPDKLPSKYHTVIDLPAGKQGNHKLKKSPSGWKSFFSRGWYSGSTRDKGRPSFRSSRKSSTASLPHTSIQLQEAVDDSTDVQYRRQKLRTVKSAESLLQCSKESSPISTNATMQGCSHPSSPGASMDSSLSYEGASMLSKSPSLQKHIRSSSHESYFDNSIDMISDPHIEEEEEHSLFYYVNEQMQKMREECAATTWDTSYKLDTSNAEDATFDNARETKVQMDTATDNEKVVRKQKLHSEDHAAHAKVQRLSWMKNRHSESEPYLLDYEGCESPLHNKFSPSLGYAIENSSKTERPSDVFDSPDEPEDRSFWLPRSDQSVFCKLSGNHDEGYKLDPYAFYECAIDKQKSCSSSCDNDTDLDAKTVVERYGNAETVLVEVHAMQDSSSESGLDSPRALQPSLPFPTVDTSKTFSTSKCHNSLPNLSSTENDMILSPGEKGFCSLVETEELFLRDDITPFEEESANINALLYADLFAPKDEIEGSEGKGILERIPSTDLQDDEGSLNVNKDIPREVSTSNTCNVADNVGKQQAKELSETLKNAKSGSKESSPCREKFVVSSSPKDSKSTSFERMDFYNHSYKVKTPPSPIYPPKVQGMHSLQAKIESVPIPKKRQVVNIPTTSSSSLNEVRKKFELKASNSELTKEKPGPGYKLSSCVGEKETPSKLSLKQKQMFESKDTTPQDVIGVDKRKSDSVVLSGKTQGLINKRNSEPPVSTKEITAKKNLFRLDSSGPETSLVEPISPDGSIGKQKTPLPSLYTQMKVRQLQSLQGTKVSPTNESTDPWSDPILDMQEEYHPILSYPEFTRITESTVTDGDSNLSYDILADAVIASSPSSNELDIADVVLRKPSKRKEVCDKIEGGIAIPPRDQHTSVLSEDNSFRNLSSESTKMEASILDDSCYADAKSTSSNKASDSFEDEATRRERIERIKEERRAQMREKLKTESFRLETEEKERVQSKFRLRKEFGRQSAEVSEVGPSMEEKTVDKNVNKLSGQECLVKCKSEEQQPKDFKCTNLVARKKLSSPAFLMSVPAEPPKSMIESHSEAFRRSSTQGDIRDRVAMFERSKDSTEPCRLGPNGKFLQKQRPTTLTPSFVR